MNIKNANLLILWNAKSGYFDSNLPRSVNKLIYYLAGEAKGNLNHHP
jgi:hypothetical protein